MRKRKLEFDSGTFNEKTLLSSQDLLLYFLVLPLRDAALGSLGSWGLEGLN